MRYGQIWLLVLGFFAVLFTGCVIEEVGPGVCWDDEDCYYSEYCGTDGYCHDRDGSDDYEYSGDDEPSCWDDGWECPRDTYCADDGYCYVDDGGCWHDSDCPARTRCDVSTGDCFVP